MDLLDEICKNWLSFRLISLHTDVDCRFCCHAVVLDDMDGSEVTWVSMWTVLCLAYNIIIHAPTLLVDFGIAIKELSMEVIQFGNDWAGTGLDDWSLGLHNIVDMMVAISNWLNPWWWFADDDGDKWDSMYE